MTKKNKNRQAMLDKLGIAALNEMQVAAHHAILSSKEVVLLSPTGTGKTLAFLLPIIYELKSELEAVQALVIVPSRELAIQIEEVARELGSGYKVNAVYGGRSGFKDRQQLKHPPSILIGTPGRLADHLRRGNIDPSHLKTLVLDEFDKSLEIGFEKEMKEIIDALPELKKKILTSATQKLQIPDFIGLEAAQKLDFLHTATNQLQLKTVISPTKDKLETLAQLIAHIGEASGIIFCNFKDTIRFVSEFLKEKNINHTCFYGGLEQIDREQALIQFRNGTHRLLLATDLAARGIDVPEMDFIIHYQMPLKKHEFIHRNGRTARMHSEGTAYLLCWKKNKLPDFVKNAPIQTLDNKPLPPNSPWATLYISGGRKDKISKGDIAGFFLKKGQLEKEELGKIELKQDCAFVAVKREKVAQLVRLLDGSRLKRGKVRVRGVVN